MKYRIGLDIGIGSIGWAVISGERKESRIEDFGVRIFDSGELENGKSRTSQERRGFRGVRRLVRRRHHRKLLLKNHLLNIGFINDNFYDDYELCRDEDVYELKVKGLDEKLTPAQLYKCLAHTCNHRGYKDFYEEDVNDEKSEDGVNKIAVKQFDKLYEESGKRSVSEFLLSEFKKGNFVDYRNRKNEEDRYMLIHRYILKDEVEKILNRQKEFYTCLNRGNVDSIVKIIFNQRDFEDGPGDANDKFRRYTGFLESLGSCPFYNELPRGFRSTVISDVYAVANTLSQYRFVNIETGEYVLESSVANALINHLLENANLTMTDVKNILKQNGYKLFKSENSDDKALGKAIKYLKIAKKAVEEAGEDWSSYIKEDQFDIDCPSKLLKIGEIISKFQTPSRRVNELKELNFMSDKLIKAFSGKKISGTSSASNKYMCEAINAFLDGEIYGNFQANFNKSLQTIDEVKNTYKTLPSSVISDEEIKNNPVVFKSINETRKIVNAIIAVYGSPETIVIEVASDVNRSYLERLEVKKSQKENEKNNDRVKKSIAELLNIDVEEVKGVMMDKYKLFEQQEGKCLYSGKPLGELKDVLVDKNHSFEIDHIVPYSLILDNTLNNKALVYSSQNQLKGQKTPLMYMDEAQKSVYIDMVNHLYSRKEKPIGKRKVEYLKLESIYSENAQSMLKDWKSRNINDTRYITKYIVSLFKNNLEFSSDKKQPVYGVKGKYTSKFRKIWLNDCVWGDEEKNRETYLNHAVDAVVVANLTPAYIEIASDSIKLQHIYNKHRKKFSDEYDAYLDKCVKKMETYYHFSKEYTKTLLMNTERVPSYLPRISAEIQIRFNDSDKKLFDKNIEAFYGPHAEWIVKPYMPITSQKQSKKFKGCIADSNPIRIVEIDGETYKVSRKPVTVLTKKHLDKIYSNDKQLIAKLQSILADKDDKYTIEKYMKENSIAKFTTDNGQPIYKVSIIEGKYSNYYKKSISDDNYTMLGMLKYYCIEIYKNDKGETKTYGIRYVDIVKKNKKLYLKSSALPQDYSSHIMYLFKNDYIKIHNKKGELKFKGYYKAVYNINQSMFCYLKDNTPLLSGKAFSIAKNDNVKKYDINLLGKIGGEIKCSEPLSLILEKE